MHNMNSIHLCKRKLCTIYFAKITMLLWASNLFLWIDRLYRVLGVGKLITLETVSLLIHIKKTTKTLIINFKMASLNNKKSLRSIPNNIGNVLKEFCQSTSLHGYSQLCGYSNSIGLKIVWVVVIFFMTTLGAIFLVINTKQFLEAGIFTTIETISAPLSVSL